jgi:hypothetical protein
MVIYKSLEQVQKEVGDFILLDKSWIIRMGIQDLFRGYSDIVDFLKNQKDLGGDLEALGRVARDWNGKGPLNVGESGTIYRFVRFYLWQDESARELITEGTLTKRAKEKICDNSDLVHWSSERLGKLDEGTTQWQTMAYLLRDRIKVNNPKYKLQVTYDAVEHWENARAHGEVWQPRKDPTLFNQAMVFLKKLNKLPLEWIPEQAEDYCFARAFGYADENSLNSPEGKRMFESVRGHEVQRVNDMNELLQQIRTGERISSKDHRGVQSAAMLIKTLEPTLISESIRIRFDNPSCVSKTMPKFWDFMKYVDTCVIR